LVPFFLKLYFKLLRFIRQSGNLVLKAPRNRIGRHSNSIVNRHRGFLLATEERSERCWRWQISTMNRKLVNR
jgi:hypothetical protein